MDIDGWVDGLTDLLAPHVAMLARPVTGKAPPGGGPPPHLKALWPKLRVEVERNATLLQAAQDVASSPTEPDARAALRWQLKRLLQRDPQLGDLVRDTLARARAAPGGAATRDPRELFGAFPGDDKVLARLEMVALLRTGVDPGAVAQRFGVDKETLFRLNASFSLCGVAGLVPERGVENWFDRLDGNDGILRRLEMVRLVRRGVPVATVAQQFQAVEEYVQRLDGRFARNGALGILTEDDVDALHRARPPVVRLCTFNLHGTHDAKPGRLRQVARELAVHEPHVVALQEVISGHGVDDTGQEVATWSSAITGYHYRSHFVYCHEYMETYPEGVSLLCRKPMAHTRAIDLTDLGHGLRASMPRKAVVTETEVHGRRLLVASVHLDYQGASVVRRAQVERLDRELRHGEGARAHDVIVVAGDFNDVEGSATLDYLRSAGYRDAYRACHQEGGNTFPAHGPNTRIDFIMVSGNVEVVAAGLVMGPTLSDHLGVYAELR